MTQDAGDTTHGIGGNPNHARLRAMLAQCHADARYLRSQMEKVWEVLSEGDVNHDEYKSLIRAMTRGVILTAQVRSLATTIERKLDKTS